MSSVPQYQNLQEKPVWNWWHACSLLNKRQQKEDSVFSFYSNQRCDISLRWIWRWRNSATYSHAPQGLILPMCTVQKQIQTVWTQKNLFSSSPTPLIKWWIFVVVRNFSGLKWFESDGFFWLFCRISTIYHLERITIFGKGNGHTYLPSVFPFWEGFEVITHYIQLFFWERKSGLKWFCVSLTRKT